MAGLFAGVLAAVFHAEVVAHKVGEPYGNDFEIFTVTLPCLTLESAL